MDHRELASAAGRALASLGDERELPHNPLIRAHAPGQPYDTVRAATLRALESLAPAGSDTTQQKQRRLYDILVRCDLHAEPHKLAIAALGLSRRQFYRERREALLALAVAIERELQRLRPISVSLELGDAAEAYIEALRSAGQYRTVWREARALAIRAAGEPREMELWIIASEAARYVGGPKEVEEALDRARRAVVRLEGRDGTFKRALWSAIGEMNRQWSDADYDGIRATFEAALRRGPDESTLQGPEAILVGIMLGYVASMECDCVPVAERPQDLYARARRPWPSAAKRSRRAPRICASPRSSLEPRATKRARSPNTGRRSITTALPDNSVWSPCPPSTTRRSRTTAMPEIA